MPNIHTTNRCTRRLTVRSFLASFQARVNLVVRPSREILWAARQNKMKSDGLKRLNYERQHL
jgi:hypothetical protein